MTNSSAELTPIECRRNLLTDINLTFLSNPAAAAEYALPAADSQLFGWVDGVGMRVLSGMIPTSRNPQLLDLIKVTDEKTEYVAVVMRALGKHPIQHTFNLDPTAICNTSVSERTAIADCVLRGQIAKFSPAPFTEELFADVVRRPVALLGQELALHVEPYLTNRYDY